MGDCVTVPHFALLDKGFLLRYGGFAWRRIHNNKQHERVLGDKKS